MKYNCGSRSPFLGRPRRTYLIFLSFVGSLFLMTWILKGPIWGISEPAVDMNMYSQKMNSLKKLLREGITDDDPNLIQLIRTNFVFLPEIKPYNLKNPYLLDYSCGQSGAIDKILSQKEKGFYIEAGAYDGESISNTLFFEKVRKWNGLLIEPDPFVFERLRAKNRKAILVNSCLNIKPQPSILQFNRGNEMGRVWVDQEDKNWVKDMKMKVNVIEVPCFSLYSILLAVNQTNIDYFSLDIEGRELSVLQSIPFEKVNIDTFTVEYLNGEDNYSREIKSFMEKNGYQHVTNLPGNKTCTARDALFKKK
nr:star-like protein [Sinohyriopsis cumingii]